MDGLHSLLFADVAAPHEYRLAQKKQPAAEKPPAPATKPAEKAAIEIEEVEPQAEEEEKQPGKALMGREVDVKDFTDQQPMETQKETQGKEK